MLQLGQRLGDFEIVRLLGRGGMGEVYEARQFNPSRTVALKILAPWLSENEEALERFWREAGVPAQLDHPGIVRIFATGRTDKGQAYYTMQLVRGISLAALIRKSTETLPSTAALATTPPNHPPAPGAARSPALATELPVGEPPPAVLEAYCHDRYRFVAHVGAKAARALADAHQRGFLHRDIKPSNLMLDHHDHLYLVDFGLTRALDPGAKTTQAGVIRGTPWYMSPEQARGEAVDPRSDIYSLGVTLYELATEGKGPFNANRENTEAVLTEVRAGRFLPIRTLAPDVPHRLEDVITRAMHFKAKRRFKTTGAMAEALEAFLGVPHSLSKRSRVVDKPRVPWLNLVAASVALLAVALFVYVAMNWRNAGSKPDDATQIAEAKGSETDADASPSPDPVPPKWEERNNVARPLFTRDFKPVWHDTRLVRGDRGGGWNVHEQSQSLRLMARRGEDRAILPLYGQKPGQDYEFCVELSTVPTGAEPSRLGIFVGWSSSGASGRNRRPFLCIEPNERPGKDELDTQPFGKVFVTAAQVDEGTVARAGSMNYLDLTSLFTPTTLRKSGWHKLTFQKRGNMASLTIDNRPTVPVSLTQIREKDEKLRALDFDGLLGIWVENGYGEFRSGYLTPLNRPTSP